MNFRLLKYATKPGRNRQPGECDQLLNTTPMRVSGSEVTRYGYSSAGLPALDGAATGLTPAFYRYASTENPSAQEVLFAFGQLSAVDAFLMRPWILPGGNSWSDSWVLLDESKSETVDADITINANSMVIVNAVPKGYSTTVDYYKNWIIKNTTANEYALVTSSGYGAGSGGTVTLNTLETINAGDYAWLSSDSYTFYRWFHDNPTFDPTYDTPRVRVDNGIFKICGGMGSGNGNRPIKAAYLNKTFFPQESPGTFTIQGTYVGERTPKQPGFVLAFGFGAAGGAYPIALKDSKTYWLAVCAVYDGYQIGPLRKYETPSDYTGGANENYVASGANYYLTANLQIAAATLDKFVTAFRIYLATDDGDTRASGRVNPYEFVIETPVVGTMAAGLWSFLGSSATPFLNSNSIAGPAWNNRGNQWEVDSGYVDGVDIGYAADTEVTLGERNWLARVYKATDTYEDLDNVYTNPRNSDGLVQPDIFSDEPDVYRHRVLFGDSAYLTGLIPTGRGNFLALKDRAVIELMPTEQSDGSIGMQSRIISLEAGCASIDGYVKTPFDEVYFAGYDDIYKYDGRLTALTLAEWEDVYRAISTANKQASIGWYRHDDKALYFQFGTTGYVFFLLTQNWREFAYADAMIAYTTKRDTTVVWTKSDGTAYKFDTSANDAGTAISAKWKTGYFRPFDAGMAGIFKQAYINKNQAASSGTLDCRLKLLSNGVLSGDATNGVVLAGLTKSNTRLRLPVINDTNNYTRKFDFISIEYNTNASAESGVVEFADIELEADIQKKLLLA